MTGFEKMFSRKDVAAAEEDLREASKKESWIDEEKKELEVQIAELEERAEHVAEKTQELNARLEEILSAREADPIATELYDIEEDLEELGSLWDNLKTTAMAGAVAGGSAGVSALSFSTDSKFMGVAMALNAVFASLATVKSFKETLKGYREKKSELESRKEELLGNQEQL